MYGLIAIRCNCIACNALLLFRLTSNLSWEIKSKAAYLKELDYQNQPTLTALYEHRLILRVSELEKKTFEIKSVFNWVMQFIIGKT
jgi:hypothetical protein